jgi:small subunit ribosomal protein S6e
MAIKCVIGDPKAKKSKQIEVDTELLAGKKVKDKVSLQDYAGYEFEITGGSDSAGFPMRYDVDTPKKRIFAVEGVGLRRTREGMRKRKMVAGNMVNERTAQLNLKVIKYGKTSLFEEPKQQEEQKGEQ